MRPDEFMKKYGFDKDEEERDHSLRENAMEHARHPSRPNAGTPHDWEDWERYKEKHPEVTDDDSKESEDDSDPKGG